jgi:SAM-dependent methyltransferase
LWLIAIAIAVVLSFAVSVLFGPPYVPTLTPNLETALDMLDLQPGQTLLDLGSGDGKVLIAAAERGWNAVGIEVSPFLVLLARLRTAKYRGRVRVIWGNYFTVQWPDADGVFGFILQRQMRRMDERMRIWHTRPVRLASFAFTIPGKKPVSERAGVYLYEYK